MDVSVDISIDHARLQAALDEAELGIDASELHGLVTGHACGGGAMDRQQVLKTLELENDDPRLDALMMQVHDACVAHLGDLDMGLQPLLPADDKPLRERADALVDWARGFLGGFGLAGAQAGQLSDDGREVLRDLGTIGTSQLALDGDDEGTDEDESAQMELVEYVRVGAMLLHAELARTTAPAAGKPH